MFLKPDLFLNELEIPVKTEIIGNGTEEINRQITQNYCNEFIKHTEVEKREIMGNLKQPNNHYFL